MAVLLWVVAPVDEDPEEKLWAAQRRSRRLRSFVIAEVHGYSETPLLPLSVTIPAVILASVAEVLLALVLARMVTGVHPRIAVGAVALYFAFNSATGWGFQWLEGAELMAGVVTVLMVAALAGGVLLLVFSGYLERSFFGLPDSKADAVAAALG